LRDDRGFLPTSVASGQAPLDDSTEQRPAGTSAATNQGQGSCTFDPPASHVARTGLPAGLQSLPDQSAAQRLVGCPSTGPGGLLHAERKRLEQQLAQGRSLTTGQPLATSPKKLPAVTPQRRLTHAAIRFATISDRATARPVKLPPIVDWAVVSDDPVTRKHLEAANQIATKQVSFDALDQVQRTAVDMAHGALYQDDPYPSAAKCATCHPGHYREWSVSPHAYAQLSPVFNAMQARLNQFVNGTLGDFCIRCHTPVGMALGEPNVMSNMDRHPAAREGITCVVCHRVNQAWGKGSGRVSLVAAGLNGPIYGTIGGGILEEVLADPEKYGVLKSEADPEKRGRDIHALAVPFFQLHTSGFCGACHDVFAPNGFRLEDAFSEYKTSPAARKKHQSCQDCHMGEVPGEPGGYRVASIATVGNAKTRPRKRTNHMIAGPDHSLIHPALFPHNPAAIKEEHAAYAHASGPVEGLATMREWLKFRHEEGWGTSKFERSGAVRMLNTKAPAPWNDPGMRVRARRILNDQFKLLAEGKERQRRVLATGYGLGDVETDRGGGGLRFRVLVYNGTDGHGVPTGFDAERVVFLRTLVWDAKGKIVFVSGDLDPNGDLRDSHSTYVHNGKLPLDRQLFSLQTKFLVRNVRGGEREQVLVLPFSADPLPYIRPATRPYTVLGRPLGTRKHKQNLESKGGKRYARYHVKPSALTGCGPYTVSVQLIAGMVPVNLVHEISPAGFDYGMSARDVARGIVNGHLVLHERRAVLEY
jgi:hypothetical protein